MQIRDNVKNWMDAENSRTGAQWKTAGWVLVIAALALYGLTHFDLRCVVGAMVIGVIWVVFIDKPLSINELQHGWNSHVPDSLLGHIADDPNIPGWAKNRISEEALAGPVTYRLLFSLESELIEDAAQEDRKRGAGWQKIAAIGRNNRASEQ